MGIEMDKPPRSMSLPELTSRCMSEIQKYNQREPHNDQCCLEIFRRALLQQDSHAWSVLTERFHGIVLSWVRRHPQREAVRDIDSGSPYAIRPWNLLPWPERSFFYVPASIVLS